MEMSYNAGANAFLCLLAVERGSENCIDGLDTIYELTAEAGIDTSELFLVDGQGADPASTTPRQIGRWMQWSREQPWGEAFVASQPILGETGSLAANGHGSPAVGKVAAKVGTSVSVDPVTGPAVLEGAGTGGLPDTRRRHGAGLRAVHERRDLCRTLRRAGRGRRGPGRVAAAFQRACRSNRDGIIPRRGPRSRRRRRRVLRHRRGRRSRRGPGSTTSDPRLGRALGGTWHWNPYPGVAVDIPAFSYQFSFERATTGRAMYAPGRGAAAYAEHCARQVRRPRGALRFDTRVTRRDVRRGRRTSGG